MKFTLSWLKDHLETSATLTEIVETLTRIGLEVEHVHDPAAQLKDFIIAHVVDAKPHPNADRLRVCLVETGTGAPIQVVCGAPNARAGLKTVFSAPGTYIPAKKITLGKGVIRGVESLGMLCSAAELELSNDHEGIIERQHDVAHLLALFVALSQDEQRVPLRGARCGVLDGRTSVADLHHLGSLSLGHLIDSFNHGSTDTRSIL